MTQLLPPAVRWPERNRSSGCDRSEDSVSLNAIDANLWQFVDATGEWWSKSYGTPPMTGRVFACPLVCVDRLHARVERACAVGRVRRVLRLVAVALRLGGRMAGVQADDAGEGSEMADGRTPAVEVQDLVKSFGEVLAWN